MQEPIPDVSYQNQPACAVDTMLGSIQNISSIIRLIAGLSGMAVLAIVTLETVYWAQLAPLSTSALMEIHGVFLLSVGLIAANWCWKTNIRQIS